MFSARNVCICFIKISSSKSNFLYLFIIIFREFVFTYIISLMSNVLVYSHINRNSNVYYTCVNMQMYVSAKDYQHRNHEIIILITENRISYPILSSSMIFPPSCSSVKVSHSRLIHNRIFHSSSRICRKNTIRQNLTFFCNLNQTYHFLVDFLMLNPNPIAES